MDFAFPRTQRLLKAEDFAHVFHNRRSQNSTFFQLYIAPNSLGHPRLGLVVAKKVAKRANRRNYIKRTIREWFRLNQHKMIAADIVVRAKQAYTSENSAEALQTLNQTFRQLKLWHVSSSS